MIRETGEQTEVATGYDGGELGSTAQIEIERDPVTPDRNRTATVNVNDNHIEDVRAAA